MPVSRAVAFSDGSFIVLAGGLTATGTTGSVFRIPLGAGSVSTFGRMAHPVHDAAGFVLGGAMLVVGGGVATQERWVQRIVGSGARGEVGELPARRADLGAATVGSTAIVVGGGAGGTADPRILETADGIHFRVIGRLPVAVRYAAVTAVGNRVFVIGGSSATGDVDTIQVVDVSTGAARIAGRLPRTISHATALTIGGVVVLAGGRHAGRAQDSVLVIAPTTLAVRSAGRLPRAMSDGAGVVIGGVGFVLGGETTVPLSTVVTITAY